ncbi:hypothetical protein [Nocardia sp.]|uniref:hypothetical protein n=1 Tax=Nocardia sp. TaxID=1821 RepID=UPI002630826C|nr:hypothetical protein [Nocardia sp.]
MTETPESDVVSPTPETSRRWSRPIRLAALAVSIVVPLAAATFFYTRYDSNRTVMDAEGTVRGIACDYAKTMTNYDSQNIDKYVPAVLDGATGDFKTEFGKTSSELKDVITGAQIKSEARDARCGVESVDATHANVVIAMSISISSLGTQGKQVPSQISLVASLDKIDGKWLVSKLDAPALEPAAAAPAPAAAAPAPAAPAPAAAPGQR